jgi:hypothetical protein
LCPDSTIGTSIAQSISHWRKGTRFPTSEQFRQFSVIAADLLPEPQAKLLVRSWVETDAKKTAWLSAEASMRAPTLVGDHPVGGVTPGQAPMKRQSSGSGRLGTRADGHHSRSIAAAVDDRTGSLAATVELTAQAADLQRRGLLSAARRTLDAADTALPHDATAAARGIGLDIAVLRAKLESQYGHHRAAHAMYSECLLNLPRTAQDADEVWGRGRQVTLLWRLALSKLMIEGRVTREIRRWFDEHRAEGADIPHQRAGAAVWGGAVPGLVSENPRRFALLAQAIEATHDYNEPFVGTGKHLPALSLVQKHLLEATAFTLKGKRLEQYGALWAAADLLGLIPGASVNAEGVAELLDVVEHLMPGTTWLLSSGVGEALQVRRDRGSWPELESVFAGHLPNPEKALRAFQRRTGSPVVAGKGEAGRPAGAGRRS